MQCKRFAVLFFLLASSLGAQPINQALSTRHQPTVKTLEYAISVDTNPLFLNRHGDNYLHVAAKRNFGEGIKLLMNILSLRTHLLDRNNAGRTPIEIAVRGGSQNAFDAIIGYVPMPLHIKLESEHGGSLLHLAAKLGRSEMIKPLIDVGVPVNGVDSEGWSALDVARDARDENARDPRGSSRYREYEATIKILSKNGAKSTKKSEQQDDSSSTTSGEDAEITTDETEEGDIGDASVEGEGDKSGCTCFGRDGILANCVVVGFCFGAPAICAYASSL